jgi:hypothetical protein
MVKVASSVYWFSNCAVRDDRLGIAVCSWDYAKDVWVACSVRSHGRFAWSLRDSDRGYQGSYRRGLGRRLVRDGKSLVS